MSNHFLAIDNDLTYVGLTLAAYLESAGVENKPFKDQYGNVREQPRSPDGRFGSKSALAEDTESLVKSAGKVAKDLAGMGQAALTKENASALVASLSDLSGKAGSLAQKAAKSMGTLVDVVMTPEDADKIIIPMVESASQMAAKAVAKLVEAEGKGVANLDKALKSGDLSKPIMDFFGDESVDQILSTPREFTPKGIGGTIAALTLLGTAMVAWTGEKLLEEMSDPVITPKPEGGFDVAKKDIKSYGEAGQVIQKGLGEAAKAGGNFAQSQFKGWSIIGDRIVENYLQPFMEEQLTKAIQGFNESKIEAAQMPMTLEAAHKYLKGRKQRVDWDKLAQLPEKELKGRIEKLLGKPLEASNTGYKTFKNDQGEIVRATDSVGPGGRRIPVPIRENKTAGVSGEAVGSAILQPQDEEFGPFFSDAKQQLRDYKAEANSISTGHQEEMRQLAEGMFSHPFFQDLSAKIEAVLKPFKAAYQGFIITRNVVLKSIEDGDTLSQTINKVGTTLFGKNLEKLKKMGRDVWFGVQVSLSVFLAGYLAVNGIAGLSTAVLISVLLGKAGIENIPAIAMGVIAMTMGGVMINGLAAVVVGSLVLQQSRAFLEKRKELAEKEAFELERKKLQTEKGELSGQIADLKQKQEEWLKSKEWLDKAWVDFEASKQAYAKRCAEELRKVQEKEASSEQ